MTMTGFTEVWFGAIANTATTVKRYFISSAIALSNLKLRCFTTSDGRLCPSSQVGIRHYNAVGV